MLLSGRKRPTVHSSCTKIKSIIDPDRRLKEKRTKELLETFYQHVDIIPQEEGLPLIDLKEKPFDFSAHSQQLDRDQQLLWTLAGALFHGHLHDWLRELVAPGLSTSLDQFKKQYTHDPFAIVFIYLAYGDRERAGEEARRLGDFKLSLYIVHSNTKNISLTLTQQIETLVKQPEWREQYSDFRKKCWYLITGTLGYVEKGLVITEHVSWQCALAMYLWYGENPLSLNHYNQTLHLTKHDTAQLTIAQQTALPDPHCFWYQLLQCWIGDPTMAHLQDWPVDFLWMLSLYGPQFVPEDIYIMQWCDELEKMGMVEWSIFVSLSLKKTATEKIKHLLRHGEWEDEQKLIEQFQIPKKWVFIAKSLRAHDDWDFETEYENLVEGGLLDEAMMALLNFLLPKHFYSTPTALRTSLTYIMEFTDQEREDVKLLKEIYMYLINQDKEKKEELIKKVEEYSNLLNSYPNAYQLMMNLIEAIKKKV
ncbi:hypothetical protein G6F43_006056 [Rhizopus delemar]|nr:hypothetical protein G6F43_006056 [Rhizopus delemar]